MIHILVWEREDSWGRARVWPQQGYVEVNLMEPYAARRGTVVRVREGHWKTEFAGMIGTIQACWGYSEHAAVDVRLEDGRSELFWLPNLDVVDGGTRV